MKIVSSCLLVLLLLLPSCKSTSPPTTIPKIGVQLWSVRAPLAENFDDTISKLADMGFEGVELAGYFGPYENDLSGFLQLLTKHNMTISSAHVSTNDLNRENINTTIRTYKALGVDTLILPSDKRSNDENKIDAFVQDLNRIHEHLQQAGLRFGFHNHDREFNRYKQHTYWDEIAQRTDSDFILQLDIGWVNSAGYEPSLIIKQYPERMQLAHFKAKLNKPLAGKRPIIGQDDLNWAEIMNVSMEHGDLEWVIVEQEEYPDNLSPLEAVALSKRGIDKVMTKLK